MNNTIEDITLGQASNLDSIDLDVMLAAFPTEFVDISPLEQRLAITLYRLLALGKPIAHQRLADETNIPLSEVNRFISEWLGVFHDETEKIIGFWGLGLSESPHKISTDGHGIYAWCAWDTLFLPALLGKTVQITSRCAQSGEDILLKINLERIESVNPETTILSFVVPDEQGIRKDIIGNFCHSVLYFASQTCGEQWVTEHPGTFLMSVQKAFELAQMINRRKFPDIFIHHN